MFSSCFLQHRWRASESEQMSGSEPQSKRKLSTAQVLPFPSTLDTSIFTIETLKYLLVIIYIFGILTEDLKRRHQKLRQETCNW
jgi:hypothetical protein